MDCSIGKENKRKKRTSNEVKAISQRTTRSHKKEKKEEEFGERKEEERKKCRLDCSLDQKEDTLNIDKMHSKPTKPQKPKQKQHSISPFKHNQHKNHQKHHNTQNQHQKHKDKQNNNNTHKNQQSLNTKTRKSTSLKKYSEITQITKQFFSFPWNQDEIARKSSLGNYMVSYSFFILFLLVFCLFFITSIDSVFFRTSFHTCCVLSLYWKSVFPL